MNTSVISMLAVSALCVGAQSSDLHSVDFILGLENDRIVTGGYDQGTGSVVFPSRVKSAVLGAEGFPNFTNDPGFNAQLGQLIPGMQIGFSIMRAPRVWDSAQMNFDTIADESFMVRAAAQNFHAPSTDTVVEGIVFGQASQSPAASFHHHLQYFLNGGVPPAVDGVWLLELRLWSTLVSVEASESLYLVFAQGGGEAQLGDAISWVENNLIAEPCPADFNGDGMLNFFDVSAFLTAFNVGDPIADLNGDGLFNFFDVSAFLSAFAQGCP